MGAALILPLVVLVMLAVVWFAFGARKMRQQAKRDETLPADPYARRKQEIASALGSAARTLKSDLSSATAIDINPGPDSSLPDMLTDVGGALFFAASERDTGRELWSLRTTSVPPPTTTTTTPATTSTTTTTLAGACAHVTVIPAQGGTFSGSTSGTSSLAGSCGNSGSSPEQVFQWTPALSGTATIQTCGAGTNFDTVLYVRNPSCTGSEITNGCNDDACTNSAGLFRASKLTPAVAAGTTYFIVVDGYGGASGSFTLQVTPPAGGTTTTTRGASTPAR